ncbi:MAG: M56 family metallopeptidase [Candidatus Brocadiaceae bacterium]|nr:M56 family metallopeptidase [Candidatus Brocadiaceae bacterium]
MMYTDKSQSEMAQRYFAFILVFNLAILLTGITGIIFGVKWYISETKVIYEDVTCCGTFCIKCVFTFRTMITFFHWTVNVLLLFGIYKAIHLGLSMIYREYRFIRITDSLPIDDLPKLKRVLRGVDSTSWPVLLDDQESMLAFTSGLLKPKVYVSKGLCLYLKPKELFSVIMHEAYHKKDMAPLKVFIVKILCAFNYYLPVNRFLANRYHSFSEKAADDYAISATQEPFELATAMVKISRLSSRLTPALTVTFLKKQRLLEERIARLIEKSSESHPVSVRYFFSSTILSILIVGMSCFSLFFSHFPFSNTVNCMTNPCHTTVCF